MRSDLRGTSMRKLYVSILAILVLFGCSKKEEPVDVSNLPMTGYEEFYHGLPSFELVDINTNETINVSKIKDGYIEYVQSTCSHCANQTEINKEIDSMYPIVEYISYKNDDFTRYMFDHLGLEKTPLFIFFKDGEVIYEICGTLEKEDFALIYDTLYKNSNECVRIVYFGSETREEILEFLDEK